MLVQAMSDSLGLEAHDESFERDPDGDGVARYSPAGALQFACDRAPDRGLHKSSAGLSLDDPDHDGACEELTEGDIDVGEWYLLNLPQPAVHEQGGAARRGAELLVEMGCTDCHTPRWQFPSARARHGDVAVDRRFFELQVREVTTSHLWHAEVLPLTTPSSGESRRSLAALRVDGIYSDLRSHRIHADPGAPSVRTRPLWGVASTAPYMSDGSASSLQEAILKHDGEAAEARAAFESAPTEDQRTLLAFLRSLALFSFEDLATSSLLVRGPTPVGCSRFAPELWTAAFRRYWERQNGQVPSLLGPEAFGMDLPFLQDRDHDGLPDAVAPTPDLSGVASKGF
ncbi:MAG: di-heme oxidoredictase family protein [Planctomycetota bacterium]